MRARPDTSPPMVVMRPGPRAPHLGDIAAGRPSPARASARSADSSSELPAARSYAVLDGPEPVEVVLHPGFVTWAGRDYAVVSRADDPSSGPAPGRAAPRSRQANQRDSATTTTLTAEVRINAIEALAELRRKRQASGRRPWPTPRARRVPDGSWPARPERGHRARSVRRRAGWAARVRPFLPRRR